MSDEQPTMGRIVWYRRSLDSVPMPDGTKVGLAEWLPAIVLGPPLRHPEHDRLVTTLRVFALEKDLTVCVPHREALLSDESQLPERERGFWIWPPRPEVTP